MTRFIITFLLLVFLISCKAEGIFYHGYIGNQKINFLVDTGSSYTVLSQKTFNKLDKTLFEYKGKVAVRTAAGNVYKLPYYIVKNFRIGLCKTIDIEIIVIDNHGTNLLGVEALKKLSPFSIYFEPPIMTVSC